jgi:hypothetical protein
MQIGLQKNRELGHPHAGHFPIRKNGQQARERIGTLGFALETKTSVVTGKKSQIPRI